MNVTKTKALIGDNGVAVTRLGTPAFSRRLRGGEGETYRERKHRRVIFDQCGASMQEAACKAHFAGTWPDPPTL
jgi:hypothetical protein